MWRGLQNVKWNQPDREGQILWSIDRGRNGSQGLWAENGELLFNGYSFSTARWENSCNCVLSVNVCTTIELCSYSGGPSYVMLASRNGKKSTSNFLCTSLYICKFRLQANLIYLSLVSCSFLFKPGLCPYGLQKRASLIIIIIKGFAFGLQLILIHIWMEICYISPSFLTKRIL